MPGIGNQEPGIESAKPTNLCNVFKRGDTYGNPGVGLGLTIATHVVRLLGGEIMIESELGAGSTFGLVLSNRDPSWSDPFLDAMRRVITL